MAVSPRLSTSNYEGVKDISLLPTQGLIETGGSPRQIQDVNGVELSRLPISAHVPPNHEATEVSAIEGELEPCSASGTDQGGSVAQKCVDKCGPIKTEDGPTGSIRNYDSTAMSANGGGPVPKEPAPKEPIHKAQAPATYNAGKQPFVNNVTALSVGTQFRAHNGTVQFRQPKGGVVQGPAVYNAPEGQRFGSV